MKTDDLNNKTLEKHKEYIVNIDTMYKDRTPGISAFLRVRNGERFLELAIRSHIDFFDEIVAVYNNCQDNTVGILERLANEFPDKIKVYKYEPIVFPPGSEGESKVHYTDVQTYTNMQNYALSKTTRLFATKLDDDHLAIPNNLAKVTSYIRKNSPVDELICFSGPNLIRNKNGELGVLGTKFPNVFSGNGDIAFIPMISKHKFFYNNEGSPPKTLKLKYGGLLYFHLKFLNNDYGFANYELDKNPKSRYQEHLKFFDNVNDEGMWMSFAEFTSNANKDYILKGCHKIFTKYMAFLSPILIFLYLRFPKLITMAMANTSIIGIIGIKIIRALTYQKDMSKAGNPIELAAKYKLKI